MIPTLLSHSIGSKRSLPVSVFFGAIRIKLVLVFVAITYHASLAQFNKGRILLGGDITFSSTTSKTTQTGFPSNSANENRLQLTPKIGYLIIDNLAVGVDVSLITSSGGSSTISTFLAGPFARYYIKNLFIEGEYSLGSGKTVGSKTSLNEWLVGIGYAAFLNDYVAVEPIIEYTNNSIDYKDLNHKSTIAGFVVGVGFQIYLGHRN